MDNELIFTIRKILWEDWDPIGVNGFPEASDEYDSYVRRIADLVGLHVTEKELFDHLWDLETRHMGLEGDRANTEQCAAKLHQVAKKYAEED